MVCEQFERIATRAISKATQWTCCCWPRIVRSARCPLFSCCCAVVCADVVLAGRGVEAGILFLAALWPGAVAPTRSFPRLRLRWQFTATHGLPGAYDRSPPSPDGLQDPPAAGVPTTSLPMSGGGLRAPEGPKAAQQPRSLPQEETGVSIDYPMP